jgi:hypothetical protein
LKSTGHAVGKKSHKERPQKRKRPSSFVGAGKVKKHEREREQQRPITQRKATTAKKKTTTWITISADKKVGHFLIN